MADWLRAHEDVHIPAKKEVHFFNRLHELGLPWYGEHFIAPEPVAGEATPLYLHEPTARRRIAETLPDARFVAILREPVSRAWSHYHLNRMIGHEPRSFEQAVADERADPTNRPTPDAQIADESAAFRYLGCGDYAPALEDFFGLVGRERVLVLFLRDLIADPEASYAAVCDHIGVSATPLPTVEASHKGGTPRSFRLQRWVGTHRWPKWPFRLGWKIYLDWNIRPGYPPMPAAVRADLQAEFAASNTALAELLDRDLPPSWTP